MRSIFFKASSSPSRTIPPSSPSHTLSESIMEEKIEIAESLIKKWDSDASAYAKITPLFYEDRTEAKQYLNSVRDLQSAMRYLVTQESSSDTLVRAQNLMQLAMKRLQREFHQILSVNRQYLDAESVSRSSATMSSYSDFEEAESEDEFRAADQSVSEMDRASTIAMTDLKALADCMTSSGYGKECVRIYKLQRKSIIDETLHHLGVERLTLAQVQKMDWEVQELKIRNWLNAVQVAVKTLFYGERILCDHVFSSSVSIKESCFHETSREGAKNLFGFPELVAKCKRSPEKMFRILDLYESISNLWPEIEYIFSYESSLVVRSQAVSSLNVLGEAVNTILADFETAIQKESSKTPVPGGAIHPLTRYVMNYISFLADYSNVLSNIVTDRPTRILESPLPESYHGSPESYEDAFSARLSWFILVLLCKLDGKADLHKDVALSYLFFANNLQYVLVKVRTSNLKLLLGDDWVTKHESKVKQLASNYERMGWSKVYASLPENPAAVISPEQARNCFKNFNTSFDEAYRKQSTWVVPDQKLRDEIKVSVAKKLVPAYKDLYDKFSAGLRREFGSDTLVRYAPEDLGNYLSDLFFGTGGSGSVSSSSSSSHSRGRHSH